MSNHGGYRGGAHRGGGGFGGASGRGGGYNGYNAPGGGYNQPQAQQSWGGRGRGRGRGRGGRGDGKPNWVDDLSPGGELKGHTQTIRAFGILADGSAGSGVYSASADGHVRVWDVPSASCTAVVPAGGDVSSLLFAGGWLFLGLPGRVSCMHVAGALPKHELAGHAGAVYSLAASLERGVVFSGGHDAAIKAWSFSPEAGRFVAAGALAGHSRGVTCLAAAGNLLFSGSLDGSVRVWDLDGGGCACAVSDAHPGGATSALLWSNHLLTCGLDGRVRVWKVAPGGLLECAFTHPDDERAAAAVAAAAPAAASAGVFMPPPVAGGGRGGSGGRGAGRGAGGGGGGGGGGDNARCLAMCGTVDATGKPVLVVSYDDNVLRFFSLPEFESRGRMRQHAPVRALAASHDGFLSGDEKGTIRVWKWAVPAKALPG